MLRKHKGTERLRKNYGFKTQWMTQFSKKITGVVTSNRPGTSLNQPTKEMKGSKHSSCKP
jgi:hypothetical protein